PGNYIFPFQLVFKNAVTIAKAAFFLPKNAFISSLDVNSLQRLKYICQFHPVSSIILDGCSSCSARNKRLFLNLPPTLLYCITHSLEPFHTGANAQPYLMRYWFRHLSSFNF